MEIPLSEITDRITILRLKIEHTKDESLKQRFKKELRECDGAVEEFKQKGIAIPGNLIEKLYQINKYQWNLESKMREATEANELEQMGRLYVEIQISNKRRVEVKNRIAKQSGIGFKDISVN